MGKWILRIILFLLGLVLTLVAWLYFTLPDVSQLVKNNPQTTAIIEQRIQEADISGKKLSIRQKWVSFAKFPRLLKSMVRITEDANFYSHEGIDVDELKEVCVQSCLLACRSKQGFVGSRGARGYDHAAEPVIPNIIFDKFLPGVGTHEQIIA